MKGKWKESSRRRKQDKHTRVGVNNLANVGNRKCRSVIKTIYNWTATRPRVPVRAIWTHQSLIPITQGLTENTYFGTPWPHRLVA